MEVERRATVRSNPGDPALTTQEGATGTPVEWWAFREGFPAARVDVSDAPVMPERRDEDVGVALTIAVTENARAVVNSVRIEGNASLASEDLDNAIGLPGAG